MLPLLGLLAGPASYAQESEWDALISESASLYRQGQYEEAVTLVKKSLDVAEKMTTSAHYEVGQSLDRLGMMYRFYGLRPTKDQYAESEIYYQRALAFWEQASVGNHADNLLQRYLYDTLSNLAGTYESERKFSQAEACRKQALAVEEKNYGSSSSRLIFELNDLASLYIREGKGVEAETVRQRVLKIEEENSDTVGLASALGALASSYFVDGKYEQAEPLFERELTIRERTPDFDRYGLVTTMNFLATTYFYQHRLEKAESLLKRAIALDLQTYGPNSANVLYANGKLFLMQGQFEQAEPLLKHALAIREEDLRRRGDNTKPNPQNMVAWLPLFLELEEISNIYFFQGQYTQAEQLYRRLLAIIDKPDGVSHSGLSRIFDNLATIYKKNGRAADALDFENRSAAIRAIKQ